MNRFEKAAAFGAMMGKSAVTVEEGGPLSRGVASTAGRVLGAGNLLLTGKALTDPTRDLSGNFKDKNFNKYKKDITELSGDNPEALKDTLVRLGGGDIVDDLLYEKDRGENDPWYNRIGGRVWQNPKTSLLGKAIGTLGTPMANVMSNMTRSDHYNPYTDAATVYSDEPVIAQHELGHALDFNTLYGINPGSGPKGVAGIPERQAKGLLRDAYGIAGNVPFVNLLHEMRANKLSHEALLNTADLDKYKEMVKRRQEVLPAGIGSYLGGGPLGNVSGVGPLAGMIAGKVYGLSTAKKTEGKAEEVYHSNKQHKHQESHHSKAAAFGAMMGKQAGLGSALGVALSRSGILNSPTAAGAGIGALVGGGGTALYDYLAGTEEGKLRRALTGAGAGGLVGALAGGSVHKKDEANREDQKHLISTRKKKEEEEINHMIARASNKAREEVYNSQKANIPKKELTPKEISAKFMGRQL